MNLLEVMERLTTGEMAGWGLVLLFGLLSLIQAGGLDGDPAAVPAVGLGLLCAADSTCPLMAGAIHLLPCAKAVPLGLHTFRFCRCAGCAGISYCAPGGTRGSHRHGSVIPGMGAGFGGTAFRADTAVAASRFGPGPEGMLAFAHLRSLPRIGADPILSDQAALPGLAGGPDRQDPRKQQRSHQ